MERLVERRVRYFLTSQYRGRGELRRTLQELEGFGSLVLIGGMLRDLALFGNALFRSDLDFVIDPFDRDIFGQRMSAMGASVNRFGGYSLPLRKWPVDIWPLHRTWAHAAGYVNVRTFQDLREATFLVAMQSYMIFRRTSCVPRRIISPSCERGCWI